MRIQSFNDFGTVTDPRALGEPPSRLGVSDQAVLSIADPGSDSHVVLFVPGALDLACALIGRGVGEVTIARPGDRLPTAKADVAIVPDVHSPDFLGRVIPCARRVLMPLSTLVIRIGHDLVGELSLPLRRQLVSHGFSAIRSWVVEGDIVFRAEIPLCGRPTCA